MVEEMPKAEHLMFR